MILFITDVCGSNKNLWNDGTNSIIKDYFKKCGFVTSDTLSAESVDEEFEEAVDDKDDFVWNLLQLFVGDVIVSRR